MTRRDALTAAFAASLAVALAGPGTLAAQAGTEATVGCLRGQPLPTCRSFWLIEMQGSTPLAQTSRPVRWGSGNPEVRRDALTEMLEWNLGHMVNLTPALAVGAHFTLGTGNDDALTGIKLRARRWLSKDVSMELGGGILRTNANNAAFSGVTGPSADVRLNIRDQGSFFVRWDGLRLPSTEPLAGWDGYFDPGGFQHGISVGASAGSVPALIGSGALGLVWAVLLGLYWTD